MRIVVPFPPGGSTDTIARIFQPRLSEVLGRQVVIENRGGASGSIGAIETARAAPDGYTWLLAYDNEATNQTVMRLPYRTLTDLVPVTLVAQGPLALVAHHTTPFRTFPELVEAARRQPDHFAYATSGAGGLAHVSTTLLSQQAGIRLVHVPYRGTVPATASCTAGPPPRTGARSRAHPCPGRVRRGRAVGRVVRRHLRPCRPGPAGRRDHAGIRAAAARGARSHPAAQSAHEGGAAAARPDRALLVASAHAGGRQGGFDLVAAAANADILARADYAAAIRAWREAFGAEALHLDTLDAIDAEPLAVLERVCRCLGVGFEAAWFPEATRPVFVGPQAEMPEAVAAVLRERLAPCYHRLAALLSELAARWRARHWG